MKLQFKQQQFQAEAAQAVVDVFAGQEKSIRRYLVDPGEDVGQTSSLLPDQNMGFGNASLQLDTEQLLTQVRQVQGKFALEPSKTLAELESKVDWEDGRREIVSRPAFAVEMETGVGKTYTYIKTMYELNERYGWSKFIIVVPSVAIREGVAKSFADTAEHFKQTYGKVCRHFIYNSSHLNRLDNFVSDPGINVMIINSQAFAARGKDNLRIHTEQEGFKYRRPIDVIASVNPIVIVDEPQSVLGDTKKPTVTRNSLGKFNPLFYLTYSATHKENFNLIYRLDAIDAYEQKLVKKIYVTGIEVKGSLASSGYLYVQAINTYTNKSPSATVTFEYQTKTSSGSKRKSRECKVGDDLYYLSGELPVYKNFVVSNVDARSGEVEFSNGVKLNVGQVHGDVTASALRRLQIRETIKTHLEKERILFKQGIKVLSLFFIDEVAKYRQYEDGEAKLGEYAEIFEEEYAEEVSQILLEELPFEEDDGYRIYLERSASEVHNGYFSVDKKGHAVDSRVKRGEEHSDDVSAYDLIMKDKKRLLSFAEPTRFIFSHSALKEGWDNPNVFQICTLRESDSEIKKRQEIGRGLRLCVNQDGVRMDKELLGEDGVHEVNKLTVVASESYDTFAKALQSELLEVIKNRPTKIDIGLFKDREFVIGDSKRKITEREITRLLTYLEDAQLVDENGLLTDAYHELEGEAQVKAIEEIIAKVDPGLVDFTTNIKELIDSVYDSSRGPEVTDGRRDLRAKLNKEKFNSTAFAELWQRINTKTYYQVEFSEEELKTACLEELKKLKVTNIAIKTTTGSLGVEGDNIEMIRDRSNTNHHNMVIDKHKYDLLGEIADQTNLTRKTVASLLTSMEKAVFNQYKKSPFEFIRKAIEAINQAKAELVVKNINYYKLSEEWQASDIFPSYGVSGEYGKNLLDTPNRHLYDKLRYDSSTVEKPFAEELETNDKVELYIKLPGEYVINTPLGTYNPDWAIVLKGEGANTREVYFVAETKGALGLNLRPVEDSKIACATKHYQAISDGEVQYHAVTSFDEVLERVRG